MHVCTYARMRRRGGVLQVFSLLSVMIDLKLANHSRQLIEDITLIELDHIRGTKLVAWRMALLPDCWVRGERLHRGRVGKHLRARWPRNAPATIAGRTRYHCRHASEPGHPLKFNGVVFQCPVDQESRRLAVLYCKTRTRGGNGYRP